MKQYVFELIKGVIDDFDSSEGDEISLNSLKGMLLFLYSLKSFKEPIISISGSGLFYIDWEKNINDSLTIRFKSNFSLEYSLFQPSQYSSMRNIRNGVVHVLDFKDEAFKFDFEEYIGGK